MVACLHCDRAPRGFGVVCVHVCEHETFAALLGSVSVCMGEGGGRAGGYY